jgi:hypothetical protein
VTDPGQLRSRRQFAAWLGLTVGKNVSAGSAGWATNIYAVCW